MKIYEVEVVKISPLNFKVEARSEEEVYDILDDFFKKNDIDLLYDLVETEDEFDINIEEKSFKSLMDFEEIVKNYNEKNLSFCEKCNRNL